MKALALVVVVTGTAHAAPLRAVLDTGLEGICAVTASGTIVCQDAAALPSIDIAARDFVPAYNPVVVRADGTVVRTRRAGSDSPPPSPIVVPFKVRSAGLSGSSKSAQLCVAGENGELACGPFEHASDSAKIPFTIEKGRFVDVQFDGQALWAIDDKGGLWCRGAGNCARAYAARKKGGEPASLLDLARSWPSPLDQLADAPMFRVSTGVKRIYTGGTPCIEPASSAGTLVCWSDAPPSAYPRPKGDEIASIGA